MIPNPSARRIIPLSLATLTLFFASTPLLNAAPAVPESSDAAIGSAVDVGEPFGELILVDEIDPSVDQPDRHFGEHPAGVSRVETLLGKPARVVPKTPGEAAYITYRIGEGKSLKAGGAYVLEIEYPEDKPRSMVVMNAGNETSLGFHTGPSVGDAFHPKYVNNLNESINTPLSGKHQTWRMFFNLHDRFHSLKYVRGKGPRELAVGDGFPMTLAQWSAENIPLGEGVAVSRIRLYEVPEPAKLDAKYTLPPDDLPHRRIFWREEMADNVVESDKENERGLADPIDWYRYKANLMGFLGINTYTKDLLEFGANQGWDSTPYGGNAWVYFSDVHKGFWPQIVKVMGDRGFDILPYYEYSGSKGQKGLGNEKRAKPLTRDDAYTHTTWIENANADITDPDTYADFQKMLDLTVIRLKNEADFAGIWIRPRAQIPMSFGDGARDRFAKEANGGRAVTKDHLKNDAALLAKYKKWWYGKRQEFLVAMRDYLREHGIADATVLFTAYPGEPGVPFDTWDSVLVTDEPGKWMSALGKSENEKERKIRATPVLEVVQKDLYVKALLAEPKTWGDWEVNHASPPADPANYQRTEGVLMTLPYNRLYTVASPKPLAMFEGPSGLAMLRYFSLNENMMFDQSDEDILGYFCADIEKAGPYCMMAEVEAIANGDPTYLGYLTGRSYNRGFPEYVRNFNTAFLSLPALPSKKLSGASATADVVVRAIETEKHGTYLAVVNAGMKDQPNVVLTLRAGNVTDAATGEAIPSENGKVRLSLYPYQLRALHIAP